MGVVEMDSNYYGSSLSTVSAQMKFWIADHDFGSQICNAGYSDFFEILAEVAFNVWDNEEEIGQEDEGGA
jgi:hypothetical protein